MYTLITGASSGIGKELAILAAQDGRNLVLTARNKAGLEALASDLMTQYGILTEVITSDLSENGAVDTLLEVLRRKKLSINTLINNAGFGDYGRFAVSNGEVQTRMINLNIRALTELTHALVPCMVKSGSGQIMNVASVAAFIPGPFMSVYFASKAYVLSFSEALAEELQGSGVSVTCLCPGSTKTGFGDKAHTKKNHSTQTSRVTAEDVATFGWKALKNGKRVAVHRVSNRYLVWVIRFLPRTLVTRAVGHMQK